MLKRVRQKRRSPRGGLEQKGKEGEGDGCICMASVVYLFIVLRNFRNATFDERFLLNLDRNLSEAVSSVSFSSSNSHPWSCASLMLARLSSS
jgi:hypothetical protein